ncbi:hypothetical protein NQ318_018587 [Aromia moschata]|uniref:Uncharacterized protein n=1 Tax=Aromia moschata TaxID=1265417 RepID=A0AAV8ZIH0_9CUCU|nr:hypothetical protein NQ318_018587 [Aromia moschata]
MSHEHFKLDDFLDSVENIRRIKSHNDEDMSDGEGGHSAGDHDDQDSCDEMRRHGLLADHGDVLAKLKMQVRDIKVGKS